jgi:hypothetical protein
LSREFFQYTRDNAWKQVAAGPTENWIHIEGMAAWQIKAALTAIESIGLSVSNQDPS